MAAWQDEVGEHCVTGVVSLAVSDEGSDVHFEAFQVRLLVRVTCTAGGSSTVVSLPLSAKVADTRAPAVVSLAESAGGSEVPSEGLQVCETAALLVNCGFLIDCGLVGCVVGKIDSCFGRVQARP